MFLELIMAVLAGAKFPTHNIGKLVKSLDSLCSGLHNVSQANYIKMSAEPNVFCF